MTGLTFNDYSDQVTRDAMYEGKGSPLGLHYLGLQLASEAGEAVGKIAKSIRDDGNKITHERRRALMLELGDVLWYIAVIAKELYIPLENVAIANQIKRKTRIDNNTIHGEGDDR